MSAVNAEPIERVQEYFALGFDPVPVEPRSKRITAPNWQTREFRLNDFRKDSNIGLRLGKFGLSDVDLDCGEARIVAPLFLPATGFVFGRASSRASHWFYRVDPVQASLKLMDPTRPKADGTIVELRGVTQDGQIGFQTVAPGSIHQDSGELVEFEPGMNRIVANVDADMILRAVHRIGAAALLARHFPAEGSGRNEAFLAMASVLAGAESSEADAELFNFAVYSVLWGERANRRACASEVRATYDKHQTGSKVIGIPRLKKLIQAEAVDAALRWLGIDGRHGADERAAANSGAAAGICASGPNLASFPYTDSGNAERFALVFADDFRYCAPSHSWLAWTGTHWGVDRTGRVPQAAKQIARKLYAEASSIEDRTERAACAGWARRTENHAALKALATLAQAEPPFPILPEAFDVDPWLLNCQNGTVDLQTGELRPHRRLDFITRLAPVNYDASARSEIWERFLSESTGGDLELLDFLTRATGYSISGSTREEKLFLVLGPGGTGKSTFIEGVRACLGDYSKVADFEAFIQKRDAGIRNDLAALAGRRLVVSIEVEEGRRLAEGLVKSLTGGDTITARFLHQEFFEYRPAFKLWLIANDPPKVRHADDAIWRRIVRLPFEHVVAPERRDFTLKARLCTDQNVRSAILAWAVEGCLRWQERGLDPPQCVRNATAAYRKSQNPLQDFIGDCCELDPEALTPVAKLRTAYEGWSAETGFASPLNPNRFADALRTFDCEAFRDRTGRYWRGIQLRGQNRDTTRTQCFQRCDTA